VLRPPANLRFLLPVVASGLVSFTLCGVMAVFLVREQQTSAAAVQENIDSYQAAAALEESLADLVTLLKHGVEGVTALNDRIGRHIAGSRRFADHPAEVALVDRVEGSFRRYLAIWEGLPVAPGRDRDTAVRSALELLETETVKDCQDLRVYNADRIDASERGHLDTLRKLAWGLAGIGGSAGLAGLFLGYGVARGLSRSIHQLQVRVQGAAGLLGNDFPAVELAAGGRLDQLDLQVRSLVGQIEETVARLNQREREVRRAEQLAAVGQLAAGMAHEIRNPLTSIKLLVQTAAEAGPEAGVPTDDLAVIEREIRRVERSLQTFLDYARPPKPAKAPTDVARVLADTLDLVRGRAARQHVTTRFDPPARTVTVDADPEQLRQVFVNLALNALDAMPGGGTLTVELRGGRVAEVTFRDTGSGIAAQARGRLFLPFASTKETGLGLGLVICRRIVEDHGGTGEGGDAPGGGAEFVVRLPLRTPSPAGVVS
jgi:signal transduction histidine kinase